MLNAIGNTTTKLKIQIMKDLLKVYVKNKKLYITIGEDALTHAAQGMPEDPCRVINKSELIKKVCNYLQSEDQATGLTPVQHLLDRVFQQLIDDGDYCIEPCEIPY